MAKKTKLSIFLSCFCLLMSFSCKAKGPNEQFIQGKWRAGGVLDPGPGKQGRMSWQMILSFDNGKHTKEGYPEFHQKAKYKVVSESDDEIKLLLSGISGNGALEDHEITLKLDRQKNTLTLDNQVYERVVP